MKKFFLLLFVVMTSIYATSAEQPSELWITGSAVPGGTAKLTTRPNGTHFYAGTLTAGEFKFMNTETTGENTHYIVPKAGEAFSELVLLDKTGWTATVSDVLSGYPVENVIDGNYDNFWNGATSGFPLPHWIVIDMQNPVALGKIDTWRRPFAVALAKSIEYYIGNDPNPNATAWTKIASGNSWVADKNTLDITTPATGRYLKLVMYDSDYAGGVCAIAEIDIYSKSTERKFEITDNVSTSGWTLSVADAVYKLNVDFPSEIVSGDIYVQPFENLHLIGGCSCAGWNPSIGIPFVQDTQNQNVFVFDGLLSINEGDENANLFYILGQKELAPYSLHPYTANEPILSSDYVLENIGNNKWSIAVNQQGRYIIKANVFLETIEADFIEPSVRPVYSKGSDEHWYYMQLVGSGLMVEQQGDGQKLATVAAKVDDKQLWKIELIKRDLNTNGEIYDVVLITSKAKAADDQPLRIAYRYNGASGSGFEANTNVRIGGELDYSAIFDHPDGDFRVSNDLNVDNEGIYIADANEDNRIRFVSALTDIQSTLVSKGKIYTKRHTLYIEGFSETASFAVYNSLGQKIVSYSAIFDNKQIEIPSAGVYVVTVQDKGKEVNKKIIIQ
jgi:hypothetical protein